MQTAGETNAGIAVFLAIDNRQGPGTHVLVIALSQDPDGFLQLRVFGVRVDPEILHGNHVIFLTGRKKEKGEQKSKCAAKHGKPQEQQQQKEQQQQQKSVPGGAGLTDLYMSQSCVVKPELALFSLLKKTEFFRIFALSCRFESFHAPPLAPLARGKYLPT
jgi:hypothetical protein